MKFSCKRKNSLCQWKRFSLRKTIICNQKKYLRGTLLIRHKNLTWFIIRAKSETFKTLSAINEYSYVEKKKYGNFSQLWIKSYEVKYNWEKYLKKKEFIIRKTDFENWRKTWNISLWIQISFDVQIIIWKWKIFSYG